MEDDVIFEYCAYGKTPKAVKKLIKIGVLSIFADNFFNKPNLRLRTNSLRNWNKNFLSATYFRSTSIANVSYVKVHVVPTKAPTCDTITQLLRQSNPL